MIKTKEFKNEIIFVSNHNTLVIHVVPVNDTEEHDVLNVKCRCNPTKTTTYPDDFDPTIGGAIMVEHRSFDGREAVQEALELLKN